MDDSFQKRMFVAFLISSVFILISYYFMPKNQYLSQEDKAVNTEQIKEEKNEFIRELTFYTNGIIQTNRIYDKTILVEIDTYGGRILDLYVDGKWNQTKKPIRLYWQENPYLTGDLFFGSLENISEIKERPFYRVVKQESNLILLEAVLKYKDRKIIINKKYEISGDYQLNYEVTVKNADSKEINIDIGGNSLSVAFSYGFSSVKEKNPQNMLYADYFDRKPRKVLKGGLFRKRETLFSIHSPKWFSVHNNYFIAITKPDFTNFNTKFLLVREEKLYSEIVCGIEMPALSLMPGEEKTFKVNLYVGPKNEELLGKIDKTYKKLFAWPVAFNWFMKPMEKGLYYLAHFIATLVKNWGITIILLALIIKLLLSPLSIQAAVSIKKSNLLQPKLKKLQEKYRDDQQMLNQKIAELYKKEKVNPLGGCLPILLQFPVFFVLYRVLSTSVELKGAGFLWIKDLTMPDTLFKTNLPFLSTFNLLPIIMTLVQIFQMKIQSMRTPGTAKEQQMINTYLLPVFFLFIFWNMPSGLVLYWTVQNLFSIVEQEIINLDKQIKV
ncbi:MAG: YidC/Oxa1 family insertase periplasmic-domain containing protein [Brevinematia bacterium]